MVHSRLSLIVLAIAAVAHAGDTPGYLRKLETPLASLPPWPYGRFKVWDSLTPEQQIIVYDGLDYEKLMWNLPGQASIEALSFETINLTSLGIEVDADVQLVEKASDTAPIDVLIKTLSITEDEWDCYINHYVDYSWAELELDNITQYYETLGWTQEIWETDVVAFTEGMEWDELDDEQRAAAEALCFFQELWAEDVEISEWQHEPPNVTDAERATVLPWDLPPIRFVEWKDLSVDQRNNATALGYNETSWDTPGTGIEIIPIHYKDLSTEKLAATSELGLDEFFWDCLIQHYRNFAWSELPGKGVQRFWVALGWTFDSWHGFLPPPDTDNSTYAALTPEQQEAALQLCFLPETFERGSHLSDVYLQGLSAPPSTSPTSLSPM